MSQKIRMYGPYSLEHARQYVREHHKGSLVLLKSPDRRIAVCGAATALELKAKGFTPIDAEK